MGNEGDRSKLKENIWEENAINKKNNILYNKKVLQMVR